MFDNSTPLIEISISTSSATLDILGDEPFNIILTAVLRSSHAITFSRVNTIFDVGTALHDSGLSFTSVNTAEAATRFSDGLVCSFSLAPESDIPKHDAITLQPNKEHSVVHTLGPFRGKKSTAGAADEEKTRREGWTGPKAGIWYGTLGLESETYVISVPDDRCIPLWKYAPSIANLWGLMGDQLHREPVRFLVKKTAVVSVKQVQDPRDMSISFQM